jgi:glycine cleavage system H lipoate-binding protein/ABC-type phosphate transport system substrate-binding protein
MRKKALFSKLIILLLLSAQASTFAYYGVDEVSQENRGESLQVWTSATLLPMISSWVSEYTLGHENIIIEVNTFTDEQSGEEMLTQGSIGFLTAHQLTSFKQSAEWILPIGRDVLVPITNTNNPYLQEILETGVSRDLLKSIISKEAMGTTQAGGFFAKNGIFSTNKNNEPTQIALFLDSETNELSKITFLSEEELIETIKKDASCIGFCHLSDILSADQTGFIDGITLVPIDENKNGTVDNFENIYTNLESFARGVWIGKYPHELSYTIYSIASNRPVNQAEQAFLEWILGQGQNSIADNGYTPLLSSERKANIASLYIAPKSIVSTAVSTKNTLGVILSVSIILIALIFVVYLIRLFRSDSTVKNKLSVPKPVAFNDKNINIPSGIFFNKNHSWAFMEKDGFVRIGIDDFLSRVTGALTNIKLKEPGERIKKGDHVFSIIQHGKQLDIQSPVTGTIVKSNTQLLSDTSLINQDPYAAGWVYEIEPLNWLSEIGSFMMGLEYTEWITKEFVRLKDFMANCCKNKEHNLPIMVMQDGGELRNKPLQEAGPLTWEEFQTKFIEQ